MTVPATIRKLEKIEKVHTNKGNSNLDYAFTKNKEFILSTFDIDKADINKLQWHNEQLSARQAPMN